MKQLLITGGCGFIGSNLAVALSAEGYQVTCFDNLSRRGSEVLLQRVCDHGCRFVHGDVRNPEDLARLRGEVEVLIDCSAEPSVLVGAQGADASYVVSNNLIGSLNCFEFARRWGAGVIFLSTSRVYPYSSLNRLPFVEQDSRVALAEECEGVSQWGVSVDFPLTGSRSLYGATKLAAEFILQEYSTQYDLPALVNRCGVIAGPWQMGKVDQGVFTFWLAQHYLRRPLRYIGFGGTGKQVRDLLHVADLVDLVKKQLAVLGRYRGQVFNVGGSIYANLSLREATALCRQITGNEVPIACDPETRPADVRWMVLDTRPTEAAFGWKPRHGPEAILQDIYLWLRTHEHELARFLGG